MNAEIRRRAADNPYGNITPIARSVHQTPTRASSVIKSVQRKQEALTDKYEAVITPDILLRQQYEELEPIRTEVDTYFGDRFADVEAYLDDETGTEFMGTTDKIFVPVDNDDRFHVVSQAEFARPDAISFLYYRTTKYWWVIMDTNHLTDPFTELTPGKVLRVPSLKMLARDIFR